MSGSGRDPAIRVRNLTKTYKIYGTPYGRLLEQMPWSKRRLHRPVHALEGVTFDVAEGQCVGLVGSNGAGKSTLLKILTGTSFPSAGEYTIRGRIASLLELGAGFHMEFTGRENIYINAAMMGIPRREAKRRVEQIVAFSELGEFIDAPLRTYSSGMVCRLGFSVAVATDPDVLILDEILSVGDMHFQRKCVDKIFDYKSRGKTLFFCSHSLYDVRQICSDAIWLKQGRVEMYGDAVTVTNEYATFQNQLSDYADQIGEVEPDEALPRILSAKLVDPDTGQEKDTFVSGEPFGVRMHIKNGAEPEPLTVAMGVTQRDRSILFSASTEMDGVRFDAEEGVVTFVAPQLTLLSGQFTVMTGIMDGHGVHRYHQIPTDRELVVQSGTKEVGLFREEHRWVVEPLVPGAEPETSA
ncbi:MAG: ABC transporter ATP-binding protein [Planctomycetota bacterium]|jgi:ABC-type polysaccharide/polyol phosphate transport system ATPase subunit